MDGVRYTTGAQRGGISTFFDLVEPSALEAVEVVRGPSSAEYGSDALGGSVQLLTRAPALSADGGRLAGSFSAQRRHRRRELRLGAERWPSQASGFGAQRARSPAGASTRCGPAAASTRTAR